MMEPDAKYPYPVFIIGKSIETFVLALVLKSDNAKFKPGDLIRAMLPLQEFIPVSKTNCPWWRRSRIQEV